MSIDYRDLGYGEIGLTVPTPDELCEKCIAPDCNHMGPLWTCPWRKKAKQDGKDKA